MSISITKKTSTVHTTASSNRNLKYIVIHYTAGTSSASGKAANTASYFATTSNQASADFIVDDSNIVQYNPDIQNRYCWHCGGSKVSGTKGGSMYGTIKNSNSIGVEICSTNSTGKVPSANDSTWSFTDAAVTKAVELVNYLMETYGISKSNVYRHYDVTGKLCPGIVGWNADSGSEAKWTAFKARLGTSSSSSSSSSTTTSTSSSSSSSTTIEAAKSYLKSLAGTYTVTASSGLNVRAGAGTTKTKLVSIPKGTKVKNYGYYTTVSGIKWLYIQFTYKSKTYTGFASSAYLKK